jgi:deoxyinosine 3'endonuclease (endonuclease V)
LKYFREQQDIVSSIITDIDQIEQPIKYVAGLDISFVKTNDKAVASMVIFEYGR